MDLPPVFVRFSGSGGSFNPALELTTVPVPPALALLASGKKEYGDNVEKAMRFFAAKLDGKIYFNGGYDCLG